MLLEKGEISDLLPCAGITLIRFYGFYLRLSLSLPVGRQACRIVLDRLRVKHPGNFIVQN